GIVCLVESVKAFQGFFFPSRFNACHDQCWRRKVFSVQQENLGFYFFMERFKMKILYDANDLRILPTFDMLTDRIIKSHDPGGGFVDYYPGGVASEVP